MGNVASRFNGGSESDDDDDDIDDEEEEEDVVEDNDGEFGELGTGGLPLFADIEGFVPSSGDCGGDDGDADDGSGGDAVACREEFVPLTISSKKKIP